MGDARDGDLPDALRELFRGEDLTAAEGRSFVLATVGEDGWPHLALLSIGEILAVNAGELRLALHAGSGTTANLRRAGRGLLHVVDDGRTWTLRLAAAWVEDQVIASLEVACFRATVDEVREHRAPYARVLDGIRFELREPSARDRWRRTIAALRALPVSA